MTDPPLPTHPISALAVDGKALWVGSKGGGVARLEGGTVTRFTSKDGLGGDYVFSLLLAESGALWIGAGGAPLTRFHEGRFTRFGTAEQTTWAIFEDRRSRATPLLASRIPSDDDRDDARAGAVTDGRITPPLSLPALLSGATQTASSR